MNIEKITEIDNKLKKLGYNAYSDLLKPYLNGKTDEKKKIAIVGDSLVGKSTFINWLLNEDILPTGVLPVSSKIRISYAEEKVITDSEGNVVDEKNLKKKLLETSSINIYTNSDKMNPKIYLCELPDFISYGKNNDLSVMSELYECDAVILVMTAERLLSESEQDFIRNYIDYVGSSRLLLVINKLDTLSENEVRRVLDYYNRQHELLFPKVRTVAKDINEDNDFISDPNVVCKIIDEWISVDKPIESLLEGIIKYIGEKLCDDKKSIAQALAADIEEKNKLKTQMADQKMIEEASVEKALIDFQMKKNIALDKCNEVLVNCFKSLENKVFDDMNNASDPIKWYKEEFIRLWKKQVHKIGDTVDGVMLENFEKDISGLNSVLETELKMESINLNTDIKTPNLISPIRNYHMARKYIPFGMGESVVLGFCLFKMVGAAICLVGTSILSGAIVYHDNMQSKEIKKKIHADINEISRNVRYLASAEVEKIYSDALEMFKKESKEILDKRYIVLENGESELEIRLATINELISLMEG